jgi:hypothetical protein
MRRVRQIALILVLALASRSALAQSSEDQIARARTHFEAGRALYQLGNYNEAVREFKAGYELVPRPQFLLNLGQCYRKLNDLEKAREMYQRYLRDAPVTDMERPQAQQILAEIERQIAASKPPASPPPQPAPSESRRRAPSQAAPAASVTVIRPAPPREKRPFIRRHWWIFPASAVVVGVAVGVGVYYGTRTDPCAGANLACWDLSKAQ